MIAIKKKYTTEEILGEIKLFVLSGPTLLAWIFGILYYPINSAYFLISVQNGLISMVFMVVYGLFFTLNLFFRFPPLNVLLYLESFLALTYLITTLVCYIAFRQKEKVVGVKYIQSLLDRMFLNETK